MHRRKLLVNLKAVMLMLFIGALSAGLTFAQKKDEKPARDAGKGPKEVIEMTDEDDSAPEKKDEEDDAPADKKPEIKKQEPVKEKKAVEAPAEESKEEDLIELKEKKGPQFKFKGQVKNLYMFHRTDRYIGRSLYFTGSKHISTDKTSSKNLSADLTRVRLSPEFTYRDILTLKADYDNELIWSNYGKSEDFKNYWRISQYNDLCHIAWEPYRGRDVYYRTKIHRAYAKVSVDNFTMTLGRQQVRYGSGKLWNPLDILNPVSPTFIEGVEEQKGIDALKMDIYPENKTEISIVFNPKKSNNKIEHFNFQDCNYLLHAKTSIGDVDVAILGGYVSRRGVAGFDFAAILFKGMLRGSMTVSQAADPYITADSFWSRIKGTQRESLMFTQGANAFIFPTSPWYYVQWFIPGKNEKRPVYFTANLGYEYNFKNGLFLLVEYFFNENAINYNRDLKAATYTAAYNATDQKTYLQMANQFMTLNQHYIGTALGYDFHPLVRGELFLIADIQGHGIFWGPTVKINAYENLDFTVGLMGSFNFNNKPSDFSEFRKNYIFYASGVYVF